MGFCLESARIFLIIFNFVFWLSGVALLGVGIWFLADPNIKAYLEVINYNISNDYVSYSAYILIAFGAFIFLVGFAGCCGAIRKSKCLIGFYLFFLVLIFAGELTAGILVAVYRNDVEAKLDKELSESLKEEYMFANTSLITQSWDIIQREHKCCGAFGVDDFKNSKFTNSTGMEFPDSCCIYMDNNIKDKAKCKSKTTGFYNEKGCKDELINWIKSHSIILIGVGCGLAAIQILGLVFGICLCRSFQLEEK